MVTVTDMFCIGGRTSASR